jgi:RNase H-fold protein (predicted Holliday junction resolvase)
LLLTAIKQGINNKDWKELQMAAHKITPCFVIVGIDEEFEYMARTIEEYAAKEEYLEEIQELFLKVERVCSHTCEEIKKELLVHKN